MLPCSLPRTALKYSVKAAPKPNAQPNGLPHNHDIGNKSHQRHNRERNAPTEGKGKRLV